MFKVNGRSDVIIQWMSEKYILDNKKDLRALSILPGEQAIIIKKGKIIDVITETRIKPTPGLWERFKERLFGSNDLQFMLLDLKNYDAVIPFECFSRDRVPIRGTVTLRIGVSDTNSLNTMRLLKESLEKDTDLPFELLDKYREVTLSDITRLLSKNTAYMIDTEIISNYNAEDIKTKRSDLSIDLVNILNKKTPYWINYGLNVSFSVTEIDDNTYDACENYRRQIELEQRELDNKFFKASGNSKQTIRLDEINAREKATISLNTYLAEAELEYSRADVSESNRHALEMVSIKNKGEKSLAEESILADVEKKKAYNSVEISNIIESAKQDKMLSSAELDVKIRQMYRDIEFQNDKERMEFELQMKSLEMEFKLRSLRELSAIDREDEISRYKEIESQREGRIHEENMARINGDVLIKTSENSKSAAVAQAELEGYKQASNTQHQRNVETNRITVDALAAANNSNRSTIEISGAMKMCPNCSSNNSVTAQFCGTCGFKLN